MYAGEFKDNQANGQGTWVHLDGSNYVGEFKDGKFHGQGTFTFPDGRKYVGELKDNSRWKGSQYDKDGNVNTIFSDGKRQNWLKGYHYE